MRMRGSSRLAMCSGRTLTATVRVKTAARGLCTPRPCPRARLPAQSKRPRPAAPGSPEDLRCHLAGDAAGKNSTKLANAGIGEIDKQFDVNVKGTLFTVHTFSQGQV